MFSFSDWLNSRKRTAKNSRHLKKNRERRQVELLECRVVPASFASFTGSTYSQNFADLGTATSGTIAAVGTVQYLDESPFTTTTSLDGWSVVRVASGTNSGTTLIAGTGSGNAGS